MKKYITWILLFLLFMTGCGENGQIMSETITPSPSQPPTEICMDDLSDGNIAYNPSENSLSLWTCKERNYQMYTLKKNNEWFGPVVTWKAPKNAIYDNFVYGSDGSLYACRKNYSGHKLEKQCLIRLRKNKKVTSISLTNLPKKEIKDISFSGTALALTFSDYSVRFYNIAEGQAFGDSHIKGCSEKNILQQYWYFTQEREKTSGQMLFKSYDIRTGEAGKSYPLGTSQFVPVSNYREKLYVLLPSGIYTGTPEGTSLSKQMDYSSLSLPENARIACFQAARDDMIYLGYYDEKQIFHLRIVTLSPLCYTDRQKKA